MMKGLLTWRRKLVDTRRGPISLLQASWSARQRASLLWVHGNGLLKELFVPAVEHLCSLTGTGGGPGQILVTLVDLPGHGESPLPKPLATSAESGALASAPDAAVPYASWWSFVGDLVQVIGYLDASNNDPEPLIGVGHSMGAACLLGAATVLPPRTFAGLHLYEPVIIDVGEISSKPGPLSEAALGRTNSWANRTELERYLLSKADVYGRWDTAVLREYIEHGFAVDDAALDHSRPLVLRCSPAWEAALFRTGPAFGFGKVIAAATAADGARRSALHDEFCALVSGDGNGQHMAERCERLLAGQGITLPGAVEVYHGSSSWYGIKHADVIGSVHSTLDSAREALRLAHGGRDGPAPRFHAVPYAGHFWPFDKPRDYALSLASFITPSVPNL